MTMRPSFLIDTRSGIIDGRFAWARADAARCATYVDRFGVLKTAAANQPRITYDPDMLDIQGMLSEVSSVNRFVRSEEFDNASWTKSQFTVTANQTTAPDSNVTADALIPSTSSAAHRIYQDITILAGETQTASWFVKPNGYTLIKLRISNTDDSSYAEVSFDLTTGSVITKTTVGSATLIAAVKATYYRKYGFYRVRMIATIDSSSTTARSSLFVLNGSGVEAFAGDGTSGVYAWGAQHERLPPGTSYIATAGSVVTRAKDAPILTDVSWVNPNEMTIVIEARVRTNYAGAGAVLFSMTDGTSNNKISVVNGATLLLGITLNNVVAAQPTIATVSEDAAMRLAIRVKPNDSAAIASIGRARVNAVAPTSLPAISQLEFGSQLGFNFMAAPIKRFAVYPYGIPDVDLGRLIL